MKNIHYTVSLHFFLFVFLSDKTSGKLIPAFDYVLLYKVGFLPKEERLARKIETWQRKKEQEIGRRLKLTSFVRH